ncbi:MAG TPA: S1 family peptidase [Micromonosporaceae bacterium]|nr:S1 family peptidase [Micromonosporaceae bacterium]
MFAAILAAALLAGGEPSAAAGTAGGLPAGRSGGPSFVTTPVEPADGVDLASFTEVELAFLRDVAVDDGITVEEAAERYGWHERLSQVVAEIMETYPDDYAGSMIEPVGEAVAWVAFKDRAPSGAVRMLEEFPYPVAVYEHRGFSEAELDARLIEIHYSVYGRDDLVSNVGSGYDIETGRIRVTVEPLPGLDPRAVVDQLKAQVSPSAAGAAVTIEAVPALHIRTQANIYGGDLLTVKDGRPCTAGFTVQGVSTRGILTAGHCGRDGGTPVRWGTNDNLVFVKRHIGQYGDLEWHYSLKNTHLGRFQTDLGLKAVTGTGIAMRGQELCHHGQTTGTKCDVVSRWTNECANSACRLVAMERGTTEGGDSGGPYYSGGTAYGILFGLKTIELCGGKPCPRSLFSQVRYLSQALGQVSIVRA